MVRVTATTTDVPSAIRTFRCCDTGWSVGALGPQAAVVARAAEGEALRLESILNAFDERSAVARLNREGNVTHPVVAAVVRRGLEMRKRTEGAFDITQGALEQEVKAYIRGQAALVQPRLRPNDVKVAGDTVTATAPVDLNGIAKGWMADQVLAGMRTSGHDGFVDAGGDIANPLHPVAIDAPGGGTIAVLDTRWNVATSGTSNRRRGAIDHLYDPRTGRVGGVQQQVTVLSRRDCCEADVLGTVLCILPPEQALGLAESWDGVEALFVRDGQVWWTRGFESHVR